MRDHRRGVQPVGHAMRQHGWTVEIVARGTKAECVAEEIRLIALLGSSSRERGYNLTSGGDGARDLDETTRRKALDKHRQAMARPETRRLIGAKSKAAWSDPDYRARNLISSRDPEARAAWLGALQEANKTEAVRTRRSEVAKALWADPAFRAKMAEANKGRTVSPHGLAALNTPELASRRSEKARQQWADPQTRERMRQAISAGRRRSRPA